MSLALTDEQIEKLLDLFTPDISRYGREKIGVKDAQGKTIMGVVYDYQVGSKTFQPLPSHDTVREHINGTLQSAYYDPVQETWTKCRARLQLAQVNYDCCAVTTCLDFDNVASGKADVPEHFENFAACKAAAIKCYGEAKKLGVAAWMEITKSNGARLWMFHEPVSAEVAHDFGRLILAKAKLHPDIEVFPKQVYPTAGGLLHMPFYDHGKSKRQTMWSVGKKQQITDLGAWIEDAWRYRTSADKLEKIVADALATENIKPITRTYNGVAEVIDSPLADHAEAAQLWTAQKTGCSYLSDIAEKMAEGETVSYKEWQHLASVLRMYGEWGRSEFLRLSATDSRYDEFEAQTLFDSVRGAGVNCASTGCGRDPQSDCGLAIGRINSLSFAFRCLQKLNVVQPSASAGKPGAGGGYARAVIYTDQDERTILHSAVDSVKAWNASNRIPRLYSIGGCLSDIAEDEDGRIIIRELTPPLMDNYLLESAVYMKNGKSGPRSATLPTSLSRRVLVWPTKAFPPLAGITRTPIVKANGELLAMAGYDPQSRLYYDCPEDLPPLPSAKEALKKILDVFADVPWVDEASKINALAAILTPYVITYINDTYPWFVVDAPSQGSGKTTVAQCIAAFAEPENLVSKFSVEEYQMFNALLGALMAGRRTMIFDNLVGRVQSASLSQLITGGGLQGRLLGGNKMIKVKSNMLIIGTANNANIDQDLLSRTIYIRLDTREADNRKRVWTRQNPLTYIRTHHAEMTACVVAIIEHWISLGRPEKKGEKVTRFDRWERVVGGILESVGLEGLAANCAALDTTDHKKIMFTDFLDAWEDMYGCEWVSANDLTPMAFGDLGGLTDAPLTGYFDKDLTTRGAQNMAISNLLNKHRNETYALRNGSTVSVVRDDSRRTNTKRAIWQLVVTASSSTRHDPSRISAKNVVPPQPDTKLDDSVTFDELSLWD